MIFNEKARDREPSEHLVPTALSLNVLRMGAEVAIHKFQSIGGASALHNARQFEPLHCHRLLHRFS